MPTAVPSTMQELLDAHARLFESVQSAQRASTKASNAGGPHPKYLLCASSLAGLPRCSAKAVKEATGLWGHPVPGDVVLLWESGWRDVHPWDAKVQTDSVLSFLGASKAIRWMKAFRKYPAWGELLRRSLPLAQLGDHRARSVFVVLADGGDVRLIVGSSREVPVAPTVAEAFAHMLAAGYLATIRGPRREKYFAHLAPHLPFSVPPRQNLWLKAIDSLANKRSKP